MADRCPDCGHLVEQDQECAHCASMDRSNQRYEHRTWRQYVERQQGMLDVIATTAEQVCTHRELEILGADLIEWPDERIADQLGITAEALVAERDEAHRKIRGAIGEAGISEAARRRR